MPTKIEWAEETWNPVTGCTPISEGCANCYAKRMSKRLAGRCGYPLKYPFTVTLHPDKLDQPLKWKKPRMIFVCSMGDLFHEDVDIYSIRTIFTVIGQCPQHTFLILTKRPDRMQQVMSAFQAEGDFFSDQWYGDTEAIDFFPNVWLGVTAENQARADERIPVLLQIPAAKRFVSVEPMLGPVDIARWLRISWQCSGCKGYFNGPYREICPDCGRKGYWSGSHRFNGRNMPHRPIFPHQSGQSLDWVICGGETGPGARPMRPDWVRSLRDQCQEAGTPFFFKSWGDWVAPSQMPYATYRNILDYGGGIGVSDVPCRVGKKRSGCLLDGQVWNEYSEVRA